VPEGEKSLDILVLAESLVVFLHSVLLAVSLVLMLEALLRNCLLTEPPVLCSDANTDSC